MNYAKMIEILQWVKAHRADGKLMRDDGTTGSPYVCDCLGEYPGMYGEGFKKTPGTLYAAKEEIKQDIKEIIEGRFGVAEFLGHGDSDEANYDPEVIEYRVKLVDDLIEKYTEAQNAAV